MTALLVLLVLRLVLLVDLIEDPVAFFRHHVLAHVVCPVSAEPRVLEVAVLPVGHIPSVVED